MLKVIDNVFNGMKFKELGVGATFKLNNEYFIKTETVEVEGETYNIVGFADGLLDHVRDNEIVYPFNCELIVL